MDIINTQEARERLVFLQEGFPSGVCYVLSGFRWVCEKE
jgi:hypothetical protein